MAVNNKQFWRRLQHWPGASTENARGRRGFQALGEYKKVGLDFNDKYIFSKQTLHVLLETDSLN